MKRNDRLTLIFASIGMLMLIFDGKTAICGIQEGIDLCLRVLIPSLFPFFILSTLITGTLLGRSLKPLRWISQRCRIPEGCESLLAVGILGGYPVGAGNISGALESGHLSQSKAERMAVFCNNAGPSFLFGIIGPLFPEMKYVWLLWAIHIMSALSIGMLLPDKSIEGVVTLSNKGRITLPEALNRSVKNMTSVCTWVILFRMILEFLNRWILWLFPQQIQVLLTGLLELSNGCIGLSRIESVTTRFIMASALLPTGGICVWLQTKSVFPALDLRFYIAGKGLQCAVSVFLSVATIILLRFEWGLFLAGTVIASVLFLTIPVSFFRKTKKEVAIP